MSLMALDFTGTIYNPPMKCYTVPIAGESPSRKRDRAGIGKYKRYRKGQVVPIRIRELRVYLQHNPAGTYDVEEVNQAFEAGKYPSCLIPNEWKKWKEQRAKEEKAPSRPFGYLGFLTRKEKERDSERAGR